MAKSNIKADEISFTIVMDAKGVQSELYSLSSSSQDLQQKNKDLQAELKKTEKQMAESEKAMRRMEAAGKDNSVEYDRARTAYDQAAAENKQFTAEINTNTKAIEANNAKVKELTSSLKIEDMTMDQLKQRAAQLQKELNSTSKSANPTAYNALQKELTQVNGRMGELKNGAKEVESSLGGLSSGWKTALAVFAGNMMTKAVDWLSTLANKAKEFVVQGVEMANKAEGIVRAFNQKAPPELLKNMRAETKGLISDLELMKLSVKASNFEIPLEKMGTLLKFAQQRAQETGESVDYLAQSIITGLGRKSPLILDNLGISASKLQAQSKKTGDFMQATIDIVNEELAKQGDLALTEADKAIQSSVKWENAQLKVGQKFQWLGSLWNEISGSIADSIADLAGDTRSLTEQYQKQIEKVADLEVNTARLMPRYEELKNKTNKTKEEHKELDDILQQVAKTMPIAVTEWDQYGKAVAISTEKVNSFIKAEEIRLRLMYEDKIGEKKEQLVGYVKEFEKLQKQMDVLNSGGTLRTQKTSTNQWGDLNVDLIALTDEEVVAIRKRYAEVKALVLDTNDEINYMNGSSADKELEIQKKRQEKSNEFNTMNKKQLEAWIKDEKNAANEYLSIAQKTYNSKFGSGDTTDPNDAGSSKGTSTAEKALKELENQQKADTAVLLKEYAERIKNKEQYEEALQDIESYYLDMKLKVLGIDSEKRAQIEEAYYKFRVQLREKEDKEAERKVQDTAKQQADLNKWNEQETKAVIDASIRNIDVRAESERLALKSKYAERLITEQVFQQELLAIEQRSLEEKLRIQGLSEEQLATLQNRSLDRQIKLNEEARKKSEATMQAYANIGVGLAEQMGDILTESMQNAEMSTSDFQYRMLMMALDTLEQVVQLAIAEVIAKEIGSKGLLGIATGAAAAAVIKLAFAAVKGLVHKPGSNEKKSSDTTSYKRVVKQQAEGKYDVIGEQDGRTYRNVPYAGPAKTGMVYTPTLVGERGAELVISAPDMKALQKHINYPLVVQALKDARTGTVPQRAAGKYDNVNMPATGSIYYPDNQQLNDTLQGMQSVLQDLKKFGVSMNFQNFENSQKRMDTIKNLASRNGNTSSKR